MKVLILGHGDFYGGGKTALMMEAFLAAGIEVERLNVEDLPKPERTWELLGFDECTTFKQRQINAVLGITATIERQFPSIPEIDAEHKRRLPKGPRNRWGKVT